MFTVEKPSNTDIGAMTITIKLSHGLCSYIVPGLGHRSWRSSLISSLQLHGVDTITWDLLLHMRTYMEAYQAR